MTILITRVPTDADTIGALETAIQERLILIQQSAISTLRLMATTCPIRLKTRPTEVAEATTLNPIE